MHLSITHTQVNTDRLRQLAHCAADGKHVELGQLIPPRPDRDADLVLSAAADEIDRLRAEVAGLKDPAKVLANMMRGNIATPSPAALADLFGANLTGLDAANLRIAELRQALEVRCTEIARMQTDLELAQIDARRYRWLIKKGVVIAATVGFIAERDGKVAIGARIDEVMAEELGI